MEKTGKVPVAEWEYYWREICRKESFWLKD